MRDVADVSSQSNSSLGTSASFSDLQQGHRCWCPQLLYWTSRYVMRFLVSLEYPSGFRPVMMVIRVHNI